MSNASDSPTPTQPPAPCPRWCRHAGHHTADLTDGTRIHTARVGEWCATVQVESLQGWLPAVVTVDDAELTPEQAIQLSLDLVVAAGLARDGKSAAQILRAVK